MSRKKVAIAACVLIILTIGSGIAFFVLQGKNKASSAALSSEQEAINSASKGTNRRGAGAVPTIREYERGEVDEWNVFIAEDNILEFRYPSNMHVAEMTTDEFSLSHLEPAEVVKISGTYLSNNQKTELAGFEYEDEMTAYIALFDADTEKDGVFQAFSWQESSLISVDGVEYRVLENATQKIFAIELRDGRFIYVDFYFPNLEIDSPYYQWKLADQAMLAVIKTLTVPGTELGKSESITTGELTKYINHRLGFSFSYPSKYTLHEFMNDSGIGESYRVLVLDGENNHIFSIAATSSDYYSEREAEGCCSYYSDRTLDTAADIAQLEKEIETSLREIYTPAKTLVGGRTAIEFMQLRGYVQSLWLNLGIILPIENGTYENIFFVSPTVYQETYEESATLERHAWVRQIFGTRGNVNDWSQYTEFDQKKLDAFQQIMATVEFER